MIEVHFFMLMCPDLYCVCL
uniref:Uncharacterized protein n=1 Tax=Arundo donax TaxID=35708 RepID=A0A0A8ZAP6_ARUDO